MAENLPSMTGAELRAMREYLGLSQGWLARYLMVDTRRLTRMEIEREDIPDVLGKRLDDIYEDTASVVELLTAKYQTLVNNRERGEAELAVYRDDDEYRADSRRKIDPICKYSASWHRMVAQRVADRVEGVVLVYKEPIERLPKIWERDGAKPRRPRHQTVSSR